MPQRSLPTVGAWCFLDRFGPQETTMRVEPHPHTGLQTVTWPLHGDIRHRDSLGNDVVLRPGELNLMTSGDGVSHSEYSTEEDALLDALQFWIALPNDRRLGPADFERHEELPTVTLPARSGAHAEAIVVIGEFAGTASPARVYTPLAGADIRLANQSTVEIPLNPEWEYALVLIHGEVGVEDEVLWPEDLLFLGDSRDSVTVRTAGECRIFLFGGEPFPDDLVMWWNFVARDHDEIAAAREEWQARSERFGRVPGHGDDYIPAPPLPHVRLTPRRRAKAE